MTSLAEVRERLERDDRQLRANLARLMFLFEAYPEVRQHSWQIEGRVKSASSIWLKMHRYRIPFDQVHDLLGMRVLTNSVEDCYHTLGTMQSTWSWRCDRMRDYIAKPKENGYQSIHVCVRNPAWPAFELQIRTWAMHDHSEFGGAAHHRYKESLQWPHERLGSVPPRSSMASTASIRSNSAEVVEGLCPP